MGNVGSAQSIVFPGASETDDEARLDCDDRGCTASASSGCLRALYFRRRRRCFLRWFFCCCWWRCVGSLRFASCSRVPSVRSQLRDSLGHRALQPRRSALRCAADARGQRAGRSSGDRGWIAIGTESEHGSVGSGLHLDWCVASSWLVDCACLRLVSSELVVAESAPCAMASVGCRGGCSPTHQRHCFVAVRSTAHWHPQQCQSRSLQCL